MDFLANTFSPMMLATGAVAIVRECDVCDARMVAPVATSVIPHEVTAAVLSSLLGAQIECRRVNVTLVPGDVMWCVVPAFRASEAREFTRAEVEGAGFRFFFVRVIAEGGAA